MKYKRTRKNVKSDGDCKQQKRKKITKNYRNVWKDRRRKTGKTI